MSRKSAVNVAVLTLLAAVVILAFLTGSTTEFAGSDATATQLLEDTGVEPWFSPMVELGSGELEAGMFAIQAAIGGTILGYCIGVLRSRQRTATETPA